jgi:hypothetical protein
MVVYLIEIQDNCLGLAGVQRGSSGEILVQNALQHLVVIKLMHYSD